MATLKDVAALAGVTTTTVSRMLNKRCNISEKTRIKIENAMLELEYQPNELARSLSKKRSNFIGLIVPTARQYFFSSLIESVEANVHLNGCKLLLCISDMDVQKEREYYHMLMSNKVRGIILCNLTQSVEEYASPDAPVMILERIPSKQLPCALADNYRGGYLAAEHLIGKGCRRLLYFGGDLALNTDPAKRYNGFCDACKQLGVPGPKFVKASLAEFSAMSYDDSVNRMFQEHHDLDGILASNDIIAAAIIRYCFQHGIQVPDRLRVVGYDDTPFASNCVIPLTTVHQPIEEMCRYAVNSIIRRSEGEVIPASAVFPVHLVERAST